MIKNIKLTNIRNLKSINLNFNKNFVYLKGPNGVGKTTILEAINLVSTSKSHRTKDDGNLINQDSPFGIIEITTNLDKYRVVISSKGKMVKINNKEIKKVSDFVGKLKTIMFSPEDLNIVKGSPNIRREFIDLELFKINKNYLITLTKYRKLLKQRNALLKTLNIESDLTILNLISDELYKYGEELINIKAEFITSLNKYLQNIFKNFSNKQLEIIYSPSVEVKDFNQHLYQNQKQDILYKTTTQGPHRDDLLINFNNNAAINASQGEIRLIVVSLKLALVALIKQQLKANVVLLLDDVLSEFDVKVQNKFLNSLPKDMQIIMNSAINLKNDNLQIIDIEGAKNE